jgi:hypothetical protein
LDLLEDEPNYSSVIDRLRTATRTERNLGRAHALLVYALAKAGRGEDAERELEALEAENPRHPLNAPLRAWVEGSDIPAPQPEPEPRSSDDGPSTPSPRPDRPAVAHTPPPEVVEPFATAEPNVHEIVPGNDDGGDTPPPEPKEPPEDGPPPEPPPAESPPPEPPPAESPPPEPPPAQPPSAPPIDTSDLPPE